ncbi:MAG: putative YigZ family protein [Planctomycetota bacterium]
MTSEFQTVAEEFQYEIERIKGSRFVASVAPCSSMDSALELVERLRAVDKGANHHCWAVRLGAKGEQFRSNDDGEPSGSAGRPILLQLEGHDLTQLVVVVARWFGGTKLGVGGLMRAYGGAAGQALDNAKVRTVVITKRLIIEHPYECSGAVSALFAARSIQSLSATYDAGVRLELELPERDVEEFTRELKNCTAARATVRTAPD